jgi:hypothetical protein
MRRLWLYGIYAAAALLENDTRPLCRDVRIHDDPKKREGYGNQIHALVFAAEFARSCGLRVAIPRTGRFGVICSRLGCNAPHVDRRDFGEKPEADFEATYVGGAGARCATKRTRDCRLADPRCIPRANEVSQIKSDALRNILDIHHPARNASCSDGSAPPSTYDVVVHNRMYTTRFERRDESMFRNKHDGPLNASAEVMRMPPFQELVGPIIRYITANNLRRTVFLASNVAESKAQIAQRFMEQNVVVCQVSSVDKDLRHPDYIENKIRPLCDDCLDVAFSEWSYLARATHLIAQLGMHCLDKNGTCFSPRHRILGRASSFSHVAATYAHVPTTTITSMKDLDPADFYPPGFRTLTRERPFPHACKLDSVRHAYMTFPDPRDIRRRGGQVPADYQDGKWREAYKKRALYKDGPYVQAAPPPR